MSKLVLDDAARAQFSDALQNTITHEAQHVLRQLLDDGVEFEAVRNCVMVWAHNTRGITFARAQIWHVQRSNGSRILDESGKPFHFRSFHELLQWLFEQPEIEQE